MLILAHFSKQLGICVKWRAAVQPFYSDAGPNRQRDTQTDTHTDRHTQTDAKKNLKMWFRKNVCVCVCVCVCVSVSRWTAVRHFTQMPSWLEKRANINIIFFLNFYTEIGQSAQRILNSDHFVMKRGLSSHNYFYFFNGLSNLN